MSSSEPRLRPRFRYPIALSTLSLAFPWGFPFLPAAGSLLLRSRDRAATLPIDRFTRVVVAVFVCLLAFSASLKGVAQLLLSVATLLVFARVSTPPSRQRLAALPIFFAATTLLIVPAASLWETPPDLVRWMYTVGEQGGLRYRSVFAEPNYFCFVFFFSVLMFFPEISRCGRLPRLLVHAAVPLTAIATGSPLGYAGVMLYLFLLATRLSPAQRMAVILAASVGVAVLYAFPPKNIADRVELILSGTDNSVNLRTWGGAYIAYSAIEDRGRPLVGVGYGGGRAVLGDNPLMQLFAAEDQDVLPSVAAGLVLEAGFIGVAAMLLLFVAAFRRSWGNWAAIVATGFLFLHCASGAFLYDTTVWAAFGFLLGRTDPAAPFSGEAEVL